jgi:hypothetical protein
MTVTMTGSARGRFPARHKAVAGLVVLLGLLVLGAGAAQAELSVSGNLFVTFNGGIMPQALPRHGRAPITVSVGGKVRTLDGEHPPALREMVIKLNREGRLETRGLPTCRRGQVQALSSRRALAICGDALVGSGAYIARTAFPEQKQFSTHGRILAFNTTQGGRPAILTHVYGHSPVPIARTFVFAIHPSSGIYGTVLDAIVPESLNRFGYLKRISLKLHRTYTYRDKLHSYLSAGCPAPPGLDEASFNFAYASMSFVDGRTLWSNLTRTCRVGAEGGS